MDNEGTRDGTLRFSTSAGWWAPALLDLFVLPALVRSGSAPWWAIDVVAVVLALAVLHVLTHPTLRYSSSSFTLRRGPLRTTVDLGDLSSVRVIDVVRRSNVRDPQTGDRRSNIRWSYKAPDDWSGVTPVQGYIIKDASGHRMSINTARTGAPWAPLLLAALKEHPDVELGPRVVQSLNDFAR